MLPELIPKIAAKAGLDPTTNDVISLFECLGGADVGSMWELFCDTRFCDGGHLNDAGYAHYADCVYGARFAKPLPTSIFRDLGAVNVSKQQAVDPDQKEKIAKLQKTFEVVIQYAADASEGVAPDYMVVANTILDFAVKQA